MFFIHDTVYMDDVVIAGSRQVALQVLNLNQQLGPPLGLFTNTPNGKFSVEVTLELFLRDAEVKYIER